MPVRFRRLLPILLVLLAVFIAAVKPSTAQDGFIAQLFGLDTRSFPHLTAYLDVNDPTGAFIHGLTPQDVILQENDQPISPTVLEEQKTGVQLVVAIAPGDTFTIRDGQGVSRYEYLLQGMLAGSWADQPPGVDDFSLLTIGGPQLTHSSDPDDLVTALEQYQITGTLAAPNLEVLSSAIQVMAGSAPHPGMERAILFITPPQDNEVSLGLQSIITSAIQENIHIYVWMVAAQEALTLPEIDLLRNLAAQTQAAFFAFSHEEPVPDLETILEPMRYVYQLGYDSRVTSPGAQQVFAQISAGSETFASQPVSFEIDLQQPAVAWLTPPDEIARSFSNQPTEVVANEVSGLEPSEQVLRIRVSFPDGYERPLTRTSLYVDGVLTAENTSPPFDQFSWDLRPYSQGGVHTLRVEATDSLGMVGQSGEASIKISMPSLAKGIWVVLWQKRTLVLGATGLIAISILVLVLIMGGRIRPKPYPGQVRRPAVLRDKNPARMKQIPMHMRRDGLTETTQNSTVPPARSRSRFTTLLGWLPWFRRKETPQPAIANLVPLAGHDEITLPAPLQINAEDVTLGSEAGQAQLVITDPSIEAVHTRIQRNGESFWISDLGSVAGTWVNFGIVPPEGLRLEHADIIHMGQVGFRFNLTEPGHLRKVVVTPVEVKR